MFSVIIPTYHRNDLLAKCLDALAPEVQTLLEEQYEIIITDDGSQTTAQKMIHEHYPWAKWVLGSQKGPAANRNNGAKHARGEWLIFTDDDCLPDPQWLEAYSEAIVAQPSYLVFEGRTYVDRPRQTLAEISPTNESGGYLWSCNFAIQKQFFESLGGFDERFPYAAMEDVDLRQRIAKSEHKLYFVKTASVCHPWRPAGGWKKLKQHQESVLIYLSLHPEEASDLDFKYIIRVILNRLLKDVFPWILQFKFNGMKQAFLETIADIQMFFVLLKKS